MTQPSYALSEEELQALEIRAQPSRLKTGLRADPANVLPVDFRLLRTAGRPEIAEYCDVLVDYSAHIVERYLELEVAGASDVVAKLGRVAADTAETVALLRSESLTPIREWLPGRNRPGLSLPEAEKLRDVLVRRTIYNIRQIKIVHALEHNLELLDEDGRAQHWAVNGLTRLLKETANLLERWARLLAWFDATAPTLSVEDELLTLIQEEQSGQAQAGQDRSASPPN